MKEWSFSAAGYLISPEGNEFAISANQAEMIATFFNAQLTGARDRIERLEAMCLAYRDKLEEVASLDTGEQSCIASECAQLLAEETPNLDIIVDLGNLRHELYTVMRPALVAAEKEAEAAKEAAKKDAALIDRLRLLPTGTELRWLAPDNATEYMEVKINRVFPLDEFWASEDPREAIAAAKMQEGNAQ